MALVGLSLARGTDLEAMNVEALDYAKDELWAPNLTYRTDAAAVLGKDIEAIRAAYPKTATMVEVSDGD